ncbi:MAG: DUF1512 domain-containing protein [Thermoprotei archaeon]|nr:MAG: DUF1512 domain-containing protein [Thermoprotei archaeon]RLE89950.1 MAG: DUF1512 domain-containing protein [Thermoprotei archaeon]
MAIPLIVYEEGYSILEEGISFETLGNILLWFVVLTLLAYGNREIEIWRITKDIERYLRFFRRARDRAVNVVLSSVKEAAQKYKQKLDLRVLEDRISQLIESVFIQPESKDPFKIITKLKHLISTENKRLSNEIKILVPSLNDNDVENLKNMVSAARALNSIYKMLDHYYRLARKFKSLWLLIQLQSLMPFMSEEIRALEKSLDAFKNGYPIGDSVGSLVASRFIFKHTTDFKPVEIVENTIAVEVPFDGRKVYVIKAKGPSGCTGHPDDALRELLKDLNGNVDLIVTVDAAIKLEGENSGLVVDGVGVAIGGLGVEKFNIEEVATYNQIPLYAVLVKMSEAEALSVMSKAVALAADTAVERVERIIRERSKEGRNVILVGVGNTIGVYP